jgi:hypothetical protein
MASKQQKARGRELLLKQIMQSIGMWGQQKERDSRREERAEERGYSRRSKLGKSEYAAKEWAKRNEFEEGTPEFDAAWKERLTTTDAWANRFQNQREGRYDRSQQLQQQKFDATQEADAAKIKGVSTLNQGRARGLYEQASEQGWTISEARDKKWDRMSELTQEAARYEYEASFEGTGTDKEKQAAAAKAKNIEREVERMERDYELMERMSNREDSARKLRNATGDAQFHSDQGPNGTAMDKSSFAEGSAGMMSMSKYMDPNIPFDGEAIRTAQMMNDRYGLPIPLEIQHMMQGVGQPQQAPTPAEPHPGTLGLEIDTRGYPGITPKMPPGIDQGR